jgi:nucleotide-binding universal stress UspA family protein
MWKDILVFADGSDVGLARAKVALALAERSEAHVEARTLATILPRPRGPMTSMLAAAYQELLVDVRARNASVVAALQKLAPLGERFSVHSEEVLFHDLAERAAAAARHQDLVVVGQPSSGEESALEHSIITGALFAGPPCLLLPRWIEPHAFGRRAMIAWKATPQAARAVSAALPLLKAAEAVRILVVDPRADTGEDDLALARLETHLLRHGVKVEASIGVRSDYSDRVAQAIDHEAEGFGADLLIMGAYGHARLSEFVFGGVTRHVIDDTRQAVLMAH